jgi:hypothetical protein
MPRAGSVLWICPVSRPTAAPGSCPHPQVLVRVNIRSAAGEQVGERRLIHALVLAGGEPDLDHRGCRLGEVGETRSPCAAARGQSQRSPARAWLPSAPAGAAPRRARHPRRSAGRRPGAAAPSRAWQSAAHPPAAGARPERVIADWHVATVRDSRSSLCHHEQLACSADGSTSSHGRRTSTRACRHQLGARRPRVPVLPFPSASQQGRSGRCHASRRGA